MPSTARSRPSREQPRRFGCTVPRVYTPPLVEGPPGPCGCGCALSESTSLGFAAVVFAAEVLGVTLFPWQRWLLIHAMELRPDGTFRFRTTVVLVARQNGKSLLSQVLSLFALYVLGIGLVLGTAQDLDTAEEVWDGALELIESNPELDAMALPPIKVNGKKTIRLRTGERYKVKAASRKAGRGLSGDLVLLDELREHTNWEAWGAITKTTMARDNAQVWCLSNAGDALSVVLSYLRRMAHNVLGDPDGINAAADPSSLLDGFSEDDADDLALDDDDESLGIFEWSARPGCSVHDRDGWAQANPSLGYGITERTIASAARTDPEWVFRTEVLCQWSDSALEGPFPTGTWEDGQDKESAITGAQLGYCVDVAWGRTHAHVGVAGLRDDQLPHVEIVASRAGTEWVVPWFADKDKPHRRAYPVAIQAGSPAASLIDPLKAAGVDVVVWKGEELPRACGVIYDAVRQGRLKHRPQPILDVAAATAATRPLGDAWVWDRKKSPVDAAPLVAVTGALWLVSPRPEEPELVPFFSFA